MSIAPDSPANQQVSGPGTGLNTGLKLTSWDIGFLVSVLVVLAGSIIPLATSRWGMNLWGVYNLFFIGIGVLVPLAAAGFILARAASAGKGTGDAGPRLGSLSTEQFAHVASWLALSFFFINFVTTLDPVVLIGLAGAVGMVVTSPLRALFAGSGRTSAAAPVYSNPVYSNPAGTGPLAGSVPNQGPSYGWDAEYGQSPAYGQAASQDAHQEFRTSPEPAEQLPEPNHEQHEAQRDGQQSGADIDDELGMTRVRPRSTEEAAASATAAFGAPGIDSTSDSPDTATTDPAGDAGTQPAPRGAEPVEYEAFWFAVGTRRTAVDPDDGSTVFGLEPGGWILALEDRGHEFLVQNTDGRTGVLKDLTDIERA